MNVALQTGQEHLDLFVRGQRFTSYRHRGLRVPGFCALNAPDGRAVTRAAGPEDVTLWLAHGSVNGVEFRPDTDSGADAAEAGRIVSTELTARRGSFSVGFQQRCAWIAPDGRCLLTDTRTARVLPGPGDGRILDITVHLHAPEEMPVTLGRTEAALLTVRAAAPLFPAGGGQLRSSAGDYGVEAVHGRSAAWCACVGVVRGETVGFAFLDHPANPWHPPPWVAREDGTLSPSPFAWRSLELPPRGALALRYRLLVHRGYVDQGWASERLAQFAKAP
jgi:hypothetical protein